MNIKNIEAGTKQFLFNTVDEIAETDFLFSAIRPMIKMAIENKFNKISNTLNLIADENNEIDIEKLVNESITSVLNGRKVSYDIGTIGNICFGDNAITINIFNKFIKFDSKDFIKYKDYLIEQYR